MNSDAMAKRRAKTLTRSQLVGLQCDDIQTYT